MRKVFTLLMLALLGAVTPMFAQTWTVTYPAGGAAASVDDVQIKCTDVAYRYLADDATATLIDEAEGTVVKTLVRDDITLQFKGSYCLVDFEFNPAITTPGAYTISVPDAAFTTNDGTPNPAFTVSFSVIDAQYEAVDATWTCVYPENGSATSLDYIAIASEYTWDMVTANASGALYNSNFQEVATLNNECFYPLDEYMMVILPTEITTPGTYMLIVNENSLVSTASNVTNNMIMIELTVVQQEDPQPSYEVTAMPEDNSVVSAADGIPAIYIAVSGYAYNSPNETGIEMVISKDDEEMARVGASALTATMDRATLCIVLPDDAVMSQPGEYTVVMPEGYFFMTQKGSDSEELFPSPEITLHYTISASSESLSWTIDPAPGTVDKLEVINITFNKPVKLALTPYTYLFYTDYSYMPETVTEGVITVSEDGLTATINFTPVFEQGGVFQLRLFEGNENLAVVDGEAFPGISATYKVNAPLYTECTPEEGATVESLQETKIKLRYNTKISATDNFSAWYICGEEKVKANLTKLMPYDFGDPAYIIVSSDEAITTPGKWTLVIEEGSLEITNYGETMLSPETSVEFTIDNQSLISDIEAASSVSSDVYSLQGILLVKGASQDDLNNLVPGLYIIGGKKVFIK